MGYTLPWIGNPAYYIFDPRAYHQDENEEEEDDPRWYYVSFYVTTVFKQAIEPYD